MATNDIPNISAGPIATTFRSSLSGLKTTTEEIDLGAYKVTIKIFEAEGPMKDVVFIKLHDSETTAEEAALKFIEKNGGKLVDVSNHRMRYLQLKISPYDDAHDVDPNRLFTDSGLTWLSSEEKNVIERFRDAILKHVKGARSVVAVHNTGNSSFSIKTYTDEGYQNVETNSSGKRLVNVTPLEDPDNFVLVTQRDDFEHFKNKGFNTVLQAKNFDPKREQFGARGSLSEYCGLNNIRYLNVEAKNGDLKGQLRMMDELRPLLTPNAPADIAPKAEPDQTKDVEHFVAQAKAGSTAAGMWLYYHGLDKLLTKYGPSKSVSTALEKEKLRDQVVFMGIDNSAEFDRYVQFAYYEKKQDELEEADDRQKKSSIYATLDAFDSLDKDNDQNLNQKEAGPNVGIFADRNNDGIVSIKEYISYNTDKPGGYDQRVVAMASQIIDLVERAPACENKYLATRIALYHKMFEPKEKQNRYDNYEQDIVMNECSFNFNYSIKNLYRPEQEYSYQSCEAILTKLGWDQTNIDIFYQGLDMVGLDPNEFRKLVYQERGIHNSGSIYQQVLRDPGKLFDLLTANQEKYGIKRFGSYNLAALMNNTGPTDDRLKAVVVTERDKETELSEVQGVISALGGKNYDVRIYETTNKESLLKNIGTPDLLVLNGRITSFDNAVSELSN